ncbi:MAG: dihydropteroate synthase [Limnobacter sp.]|nr:dihydropteroate synthase [Limnobacter sp.]
MEAKRSHTTLLTQRFELALTPNAPLVMGIVNVTPDSFSDGGHYQHIETALSHARRLLDEGADILDIGGESTRPGAQPVDAKQEWERIGELLTELVRWNVPISVDTMKPEVMLNALHLGVDILNDVNGFRATGADQLLAESGAAGVVMHMQGKPRTMQSDPVYNNVVKEVTAFLADRIDHLVKLGTKPQSLLVDPGFGFGKTLAHNQALFEATSEFARLGAGVLVGVSRKRMIGAVTGRDQAEERVHGSVAAALLAAQKGAAVVRVHDVGATVDALKMLRWAGFSTDERQ